MAHIERRLKDLAYLINFAPPRRGNMKKKLKLVSHLVTAALFSATLISTPASAAPDDSITPSNSICDLAAAGLGDGSPSAPFQIGTIHQLAEIDDCNDERSASITAAISNGSTVTFTANHDFGVGQKVMIDMDSDNGFDFTSTLITAVTENTFSIRSTRDLTSDTSGQAVAIFTHFELTNDIDLSEKVIGVNEPDFVNVAGAVSSGNGTTVIQGSNSLEVGQTVNLSDFGIPDFDGYSASVVAANSTSFEIDRDIPQAYVSGGIVTGEGWKPLVIEEYGISLEGNDRTIRNLRVYRTQSNNGLFGVINNSIVKNLTISDFEARTNSRFELSSIGGLAGLGNDVSFTNIEISGSMSGFVDNLGLLAGDLSGNVQNVVITGQMLPSTTQETNQSVRGSENVGGIAGRIYGNLRNAEVNVNLDPTVLAPRAEYFKILPAVKIGGAVGSMDGTASNIKVSGEVRGQDEVGGAFGYTCCGDITQIEANVEVTGFGYNTEVTQIGGAIGDFGCCGGVSDIKTFGDVIVLVQADEVFDYVEVRSVGGAFGETSCCSMIEDVEVYGNVTITQEVAGSVSEIGGAFGQDTCCSTTRRIYVETDITINQTNPDSVAYNIGGIFGALSASEAAVYQTYYKGNITVDKGNRIGGVTGNALSATKLSENIVQADITVKASVEGDDEAAVGGILGIASDGPLLVSESSYEGNITVGDNDGQENYQYVGGIIGKITGAGVTVHNVYAKANITAGNNVGGIVGGITVSDDPDILYSYFVGEINSKIALGNDQSDPFANGFGVDISGTNFFNSNLEASNHGAISKTLAELKRKATFVDAGWLFDAAGPWRIGSSENDGLPTLEVPVFGNGGETINRSQLGQSNRLNTLSFGYVLANTERRFRVNLNDNFAMQKFTVRVLRNGKVVKTLSTGTLNKKGNRSFRSKFSLKKGDVIFVKVNGKRADKLIVK
jgi:hypothetical protein